MTWKEVCEPEGRRESVLSGAAFLPGDCEGCEGYLQDQAQSAGEHGKGG